MHQDTFKKEALESIGIIEDSTILEGFQYIYLI